MTKIADGFLRRKIMDDWIVMSAGTGAEKAGEMFTLSESAAMLWEALERGADEDALAALLCETYVTDEATARADVAKFLQRLERAGILATSNPGDESAVISSRGFNRELFVKARKTKTPLLGAFELTNRCNLCCRMCYVRMPAGDEAARSAELSAEEWLALGREAVREGLLYLLLTGGEPLLRPDFLTIYEGLRHMGLLISVNTNATLVTPEIAERLARCPPRRISVTLYGASPETYRAVCGDAGAYERTLRGIRLLTDHGLPVRLRTTVIQQNRADIAAIHALSQELGLRLKMVDYMFAPRGGAGQDPFAVRLSPEGQNACLRQMAALLYPDGAPRDSQPDEPRQEDEADDEERADEPDEAQAGAFRCAAGHFSYAVNSAGRLCACLMIDEPSVAKGDGSFRARWDKLVALCAAVPVCEDCGRCDIRGYCKVCPAKIKGETGSFNQKPWYICEIARLAAAGASASEK